MILRHENNKKTDPHGQEGYSLIELMVVAAIVVVISTLVLIQFGSSRQQLSRQNIATELKVYFERSRFNSVKRRADGGAVPQANVVVNADSFTLTTYKESGGSYTSETKTTDLTGRNMSIAVQSGVTLPVTVSYNQRGEALAVSGTTAVNPVFLVCNGTCSFADDTSANANIVLVTPTGTVNLLPGGSTIPAFTAPPVTNVPSGTGIRDDVTMPGP